jgi:hypothetical protein
VDSSPTWWDGRVIFGGCDGWVYCLAADDGRLLWRFLAAPEDRRIMVRGQLESVWPTHGSLIVDPGGVYVAAGRQTQLDGGLWFYALDPASGRALWSTRIDGRNNDRMFTADLMTRVDGQLFMANYTPQQVFDSYTQIDVKTGRFQRAPFFSREKARWGAGMPACCIWSGVLGFLRQPNYGDAQTGEARRHWFYGATQEGDLVCADWPRSWGCLHLHRTAVIQFEDFSCSGPTANKDLPAGNWVFSAGGATPWKQQIRPKSVWMKGLVRAGDKLYLASQADEKPDAGTLTIFDAASGKILGEIPTPGAPCFDGLSAAAGRLYLSCENAKLACWGK